MRTILTVLTVFLCHFATAAELSPEGIRNPIFLRGEDPWIVRDGDRFLWCFMYGEREIAVHVSDSPTQRGEKHVVWRSPETGPHSRQVWAPELHRIGDRWYIYFAASDGDNANHRAYVLESQTADPLGAYDLHGPLYTGDDFEGKTENRWAIDMTVFEHADKLYAVWSGWEGTADVQHLFIAPMSDPCTISGPRVKMCENDDHLWERTEETPESRGLHEGAVILKRGNRTFMIYSCGASWLPTYKLGLLELTGDDPLSPAAWKKHPEPVFQSTDTVFGVGHCCFFTTDEDSDTPQCWMTYHAKRRRDPGWLRDVFLQPITFDAAGFPHFGKPERSE